MLSPREIDVVTGFLQGRSYQQVAETLGLSFETVKTYAVRIRRKLKIRTKVEMVLWALRNGIGTEHVKTHANSRQAGVANVHNASGRRRRHRSKRR